MSTVSRGFKGRRRPSVELPPGQYLVEDFPVLSAGPTPSIDHQDWELVITSETDEHGGALMFIQRALPMLALVVFAVAAIKGSIFRSEGAEEPTTA
jgi:hypothetical protein